MKTMYLLFSVCVFALFCLLEWRGVAWDSNQTSPAPTIYTSRSSGGGDYGGSSSRSSSSGGGYFSSK